MEQGDLLTVGRIDLMSCYIPMQNELYPRKKPSHARKQDEWYPKKYLSRAHIQGTLKSYLFLVYLEVLSLNLKRKGKSLLCDGAGRFPACRHDRPHELLWSHAGRIILEKSLHAHTRKVR